MISLCVDCMVGYLFTHDCLLYDCPFSCMIAYHLCFWGALVSPYFQITSLGRLFLIDCLSCLGVIPNCLPSTKLGVWNRSSIRAISMFGSTMEMTDIRAMKTCITLSWILWIPAWLECHFDCWLES